MHRPLQKNLFREGQTLNKGFVFRSALRASSLYISISPPPFPYMVPSSISTSEVIRPPIFASEKSSSFPKLTSFSFGSFNQFNSFRTRSEVAEVRPCTSSSVARPENRIAMANKHDKWSEHH